MIILEIRIILKANFKTELLQFLKNLYFKSIIVIKGGIVYVYVT